jgi:Chromate transporter
MTSTGYSTFADNWKEIATSLFKLGATSYGGVGIMGIMQAELQEKRKWVAKDRFLEGLAVANILPGATAVQLGIFLGYARGGRRARGARSSSRRRSHWPCCSRSRVSLPQPVPAMRLGLGPPEIVLTAEEPTPEWTQKLGQAPTISASHSN